MQITLEISDKMTAKVRGQEVVRDMTVLPQAALEHIFQYGFQRVNNDAGAIAMLKDENNQPLETQEEFKARAALEAVPAADKKWAALVSGGIRVASTREGDPVKAEALRLAIKKVEKAIVEAGHKVKDHDQKDIRQRAKAAIEKNPAFLKQAEANIAALAELEIEV